MTDEFARDCLNTAAHDDGDAVTRKEHADMEEHKNVDPMVENETAEETDDPVERRTRPSLFIRGMRFLGILEGPAADEEEETEPDALQIRGKAYACTAFEYFLCALLERMHGEIEHSNEEDPFSAKTNLMIGLCFLKKALDRVMPFVVGGMAVLLGVCFAMTRL